MDSRWEFALTFVIHIMAFEEKLTGTGRLIISVDAFFMCSSKCGCQFFLSVSLEEDSDEIKIGTSCKNGGCTKVGEPVAVY